MRVEITVMVEMTIRMELPVMIEMAVWMEMASVWAPFVYSYLRIFFFSMPEFEINTGKGGKIGIGLGRAELNYRVYNSNSNKPNSLFSS